MPDRRPPTEADQSAVPAGGSASAAPVGPVAARVAAAGKPVPPAETPGTSGLLTLWVGVVIVAALYFAREVLVPITLAVLLSFLLAPLVHLLRLIHLGRVLSVLFAVVIGLGLILALAGLIGTQIAQLVQEVPKYQATIEHKIESVRSFAISEVSALMNRFGQHQAARTAEPESNASATAPKTTQQPAQEGTAKQGLSYVSMAESVIAPVASPLATTGIVFVVSIFILLQREDLRDRMIRLLGSGDIHRTTLAMDDAAHRLSRYFLAQLSVNACYGCVIGAGLWLIGIPSPVLWGVLAMLLRFVPYIGPPMAAILPIALAAAVTPGWSKAVYTALLYIAAEGVTGQAIEPILYGHSTGLSPFAVIVAAIFWTWIWGPIGLILSTPLTLCLVVLGRYFPRLEFLDVMLGDQPALTPVESFYQRMLAGDPDEVLDQAELLLKEQPLGAYYDDIALPGLKLAASDAARGVVSQEQLERMRSSIESLIADLEHAEDKTAVDEAATPLALAPHWETEAPVLCVAGRGALDEAAAAMLAQLLTKNGLGVRVLSHESVSRTRIATLSLRDVVMVCVCYIELAGTPAHLRFLLRRLRQRLPTQPIVVGIWSPKDPALHEDRLRRDIGGPAWFVSSLREAVAICREAARRAAAGRPDAA